MKALCFLFIITILNGCLPLTIMSVGGSLFDRYEKKKIEERLDQLEKEEKDNVKSILQH